MGSPYRRILRFWRPHRALGAGLCVAMVLRAVFSVALALAIKLVIDAVIDPSIDMSALSIAALVLSGLAVSVAAGFVSANLASRAAADILADVRTNVFAHLQRLPISYHEAAGTGELIGHFSSDVAQLSKGVIVKPLAGLRAAAAMALYLPVMFLLDVRLAVISVVAVPLTVWLVQRFAPSSTEALDDEKQRVAEVLEEVSENLRTQKLLRTYGGRVPSLDRFRDRIESLRAASRDAERRIAFEAVIAEYAVELVKVLIILVGVVLALAGSLEPGNFAAFAAILTEFAYQASVIGMDVVPSIKQADAGIRRIDRLLSIPPPKTHHNGHVPSLSKNLVLDDVTFRYPGSDRPQLRDVSVAIPSESYVALVGRNGSGKSSVLSAIVGLYDLEQGRITVGDVDLATVDGDTLRSRIGVAYQETYLTQATITQNVTLGADGIEASQLAKALKESGVDTVAQGLPDGLDTVVGPGGVQLSAGEAQRIGIARALLNDPDLILLDEVTSLLDPVAEASLHTTIQDLRTAGRTVLSVTHRLGTVVEADAIVVMEDGVATQQGTFDQLVHTQGVFRGLWERQQGFDIGRSGTDARISVDRLLRIPLFSQLDRKTASELASSFAPVALGDATEVFREGDRGAEFYVIARGIIMVTRRVGDEDRVLATLEDGDFFGEMALLTDDRRNATARTSGHALLLRIDRNVFDRLMTEHPEARAVIEQVARERRAENVSSAIGRPTGADAPSG